MLHCVGLISLALLLFVSVVRGQPGCINNLTTIINAEVAVSDTSVRREYVLCNNTVFTAGFADQSGEIVGGSFPLAFNANVDIRCGADGKRSNNCIIKGGVAGVILSPFTGDQIINGLDIGVSSVTGITVEDHTRPLFADRVVGSIVFNDCAFINSVADPNIFLSGPPLTSNRERREMIHKGEYIRSPDGKFYFPKLVDVNDDVEVFVPSEDNEIHDRGLQSSPMFNVDFINCVFEGNRSPNRAVGTTGFYLIVVPVPNVNVNFHQNLFMNNDYSLALNQNVASKGLLVVDGGNNRINMTGNCFVDNKAFANALVELVLGEFLVMLSDNYVTPIDTSLACSFAGIYSDPQNPLTITRCQEAEDSQCTYLTPTISPSLTIMPSTTPSAMLSTAPSAMPVTSAPSMMPIPEPTPMPVSMPTSGASKNALTVMTVVMMMMIAS